MIDFFLSILDLIDGIFIEMEISIEKN